MIPNSPHNVDRSEGITLDIWEYIGNLTLDIWKYMDPYGSIWVHIMGPYGPIWAHPPGQMSIIISAEIRRRGKFDKIEMADRKIREK